ncbi:MAG: phosphopentomutase [Spirochaetes bacterium]|nr:phosphopentomutase [Spirochaetota bacterium]
MFKRVFLIVLDSVGCGALPDAEEYGDTGANTLLHISENISDFNLPNMVQCGLANIVDLKNKKNKGPVTGIYGKMAEQSKGKDTTSGHWEISGAIVRDPFPTYPDGFPEDLLDQFMEATGVTGYLGNTVASGTEIIKELGEDHLKTGYPIVYTSADSVFQIAAHEEVIPIEKQYAICEKTRGILKGKHNIGRVIARPFIGKPGNFTRTERRKDYAVTPPDGILTHVVSQAGKEVIGVGKIEDIFNNKGITRSFHTGNNTDGISKIGELIRDTSFSGLVFANLVDFDMLYGHRRDVQGYYDALKEFDNALGEYIKSLKKGDALFVTADHGNDPAFTGTDHTREYIPLLGTGPDLKQNIDLGIRKSFADLGQTVAEMLGVGKLKNGVSFLKNIIKK